MAVCRLLDDRDVCCRFNADDDDYSIIMAKALADRLAEVNSELSPSKCTNSVTLTITIRARVRYN